MQHIMQYFKKNGPPLSPPFAFEVSVNAGTVDQLLKRGFSPQTSSDHWSLMGRKEEERR